MMVRKKCESNGNVMVGMVVGMVMIGEKGDWNVNSGGNEGGNREVMVMVMVIVMGW